MTAARRVLVSSPRGRARHGPGATGLPLAVLLAAAGCDGGAPSTEGESRSSVVYGQDARAEPYAYPVGSPIFTWARSSAIEVATSALERTEQGDFLLSGGELLSESMRASGRPLCPEEPFQEQPVLGGLCSAFLVGPDTVITAGHCIIGPSVCSQVAFVFGAGYDRKERDPRRVGPDDVHFCRDILELAPAGDGGDHAVVRLDRPVVGRTPLPVRRSGKVDDDEDLILIGNPLGLPTKIAAHGQVLDNTPERFFKASTDSYDGASGSAVMGASSGLVEGVLVRGEKDFVQRGDCWVSRVCPPDGASCRGEDVTRTTEIAACIQ